MRPLRDHIGGSMVSVVVVGALAASLTACPAHAQGADWPTRPITMVVPFAAGGASDAIARILADGSDQPAQDRGGRERRRRRRQTGGERVARAAPDGYQF